MARASPEEYLHKIFDPYFTTKPKGTGPRPGKRLFHNQKPWRFYRGGIKAGAGTTFRVYIPASENEFPEIFQRKEKPRTGLGKILVMDDEEIIRDVATAMLEYLGYSVVVCCDGGEAIQLYRQAIAAGRAFRRCHNRSDHSRGEWVGRKQSRNS